jgi:hypothetical protein
MTINTDLQLKYDTSANWNTVDPTLLEGEVGLETSSGRFKVGDGSLPWSSLGYFSEKGPIYLKSYTIATMPTANIYTVRSLAWCNDATGGAQPAYCDGTNWRTITNGVVL